MEEKRFEEFARAILEIRLPKEIRETLLDCFDEVAAKFDVTYADGAIWHLGLRGFVDAIIGELSFEIAHRYAKRHFRGNEDEGS